MQKTINTTVQVGKAPPLNASLWLQAEHPGLITAKFEHGKESFIYNGETNLPIVLKTSNKLSAGIELRIRIITKLDNQEVGVVSAISIQVAETQREADESEADEDYWSTGKLQGTWSLWMESSEMKARRLKREAKYILSSTARAEQRPELGAHIGTLLNKR